jgi:nucleotide-binding universal stress UspA family protein
VIDNILVPLDQSHLAEAAIAHAVPMAQTFDADVTLLAVEDHGSSTADDSFVDPFAWHTRRQEIGQYLERAGRPLVERGLSVSTEIRDGPAAEVILQVASDERAGMIILTSHGRGGLTDFPISGTAHKVVVAAKTSVLLIRSTRKAVGREGRYRVVAAPTDGSRRADWGLHVAARIAQSNGAELVLIHVVRVPPPLGRIPSTSHEQALRRELVRAARSAALEHLQALSRQLETGDLKVRVHIEESLTVAAAIDRAARDRRADLVVISAHGSGCQEDPGWRYGSVAASLVAYGSSTLLLCQDLTDRARPVRPRPRQRAAATQA